MLEQEVDTSLLNQIYIPADAGHVFIDQETEFRQMMMMYSCAIKEIKTKLQVLNDELSIKRQRNPIEFIKTRVKQPLQANFAEKAIPSRYNRYLKIFQMWQGFASSVLLLMTFTKWRICLLRRMTLN